MKLSRQKILIASFTLGAFVAGWFLAFIYLTTENRASMSRQIRENSSEYDYINPILFVDNSKVDFPEYNPLKKTIEDYISKAIHENKASGVSAYFRDLNTGKWTGVNEEVLYTPSSMLKVTVLLAYLRMADKNPDVLTKKIYYKPKDNPLQFYKPKTALKEGYYTIRELLVHTIVESDNEAVFLLNHEHPQEIFEVYKDLKLPDPLSDEMNFMSARSYSRILRTLYNATYLSKTSSEEALKLLSYTTFNRGITQGVASGVRVAHKFGEYSEVHNNSVKERQLHDCGIIYYPNQPYLLCVMTKGQEFSNLEKVIADVSKIVYSYKLSEK